MGIFMAEMPGQGAAPGADEAIQAIGASLQKLAESDMPEAAKAAFQAALEAFSQGVSALESGEEAAMAPVTPEQGASGAKPASMGRPG